MLGALKKLFSCGPLAEGVLAGREPLELATAALLVELSRSDFSESPQEQAVIASLLVRRFALSPEAADQLMAQAAQRADQAVSLHEFTHRLNREFTAEEKQAVVSMLWQVSLADGRIDKHEEQLIWRIAGLLHVSDSERIRLKLQALQQG